MALFFISYKHEEYDFAKELKNKLGEAGYLGWIDKEILAGDEWKIIIDNAIKTSVAVIVVVSPKSSMSPFVTYEWSFALGLQKRVIPLILEMPDPDNPEHDDIKMHPKLDDRQYRDFTDPDNRPWEQLIEELGNIVAKEDIPAIVKNAEEELNSPVSMTRADAIETLKNSEHPTTINALARAVDHDLPDVSWRAGLALAQKSNFTDERAFPGLAKAIQIFDKRAAALNALAKYNSPAAVECLIEAYNNAVNSKQDTEDIIERIARVTNDDAVKKAVSGLREMIRNRGDRFPPVLVIDKLGEFQNPEALPELIDYLQSIPQVPFKIRAIKALEKIGHPDAIDSLIEVIKGNPTPQRRGYPDLVNAALGAIRQIGDPSAIDKLSQILNDSRFSNYRIAIENVTGQLRQLSH